MTVPRTQMMSHVLHNDTVGGCPDAAPASTFDDIVVCHSGTSLAVSLGQYGIHTGHGDAYGSC